MFTQRAIKQPGDEGKKPREQKAKEPPAGKPIETASEKTTAKAADKPKKTSSEGQVILIVEDEKPLAHALEMKLKNDGYEVFTALNGEEAMAAMKGGKINLVLLDLIMPHMDGFSVLQEMRSHKLKIPVIVLSNLGQDEDREKAKTLGAIDYYVKSNTPIADIVRRVHDVL